MSKATTVGIISSLAALAILSAGCIEGDGGPDTHDGDDEVTIGSAFVGTPRMQGCIVASNIMDLLQPLNPIDGPEQWDDAAINYLTGAQFDQLQCDGIEWGPFVRGPITIVVEHYTNFEMPNTCSSGGDRYGVMLSIGFSDPEISEFAQTRLNMPAYNLTHSLDVADAGDLRTWSWAWGPQEPLSTMQYQAVLTGQDRGEQQERIRWYFANDTAVSYFTVDYIGSRPAGNIGAITGHLEPPMRMAEEGMKDWRGRGGTSFTDEMEGTVVEFQDWQCTPKDGPRNSNETNRPASVQGALSTLARWLDW